jgi:hypothetical protein
MTKQTTSPVDTEPEEMGPAMRSLTPKQRLFVLAMLADPGGFQAGWAEAAGYSVKGDNHHVAACRMMQDPKIIAASQEVARQHLSGNGPALAVRNLLNIAKNEKHPQHLKATEMILNRTGMSERVDHTIEVKHTTDDRSMLELCRRMAAETGVPLAKLVGGNRPGLSEAEQALAGHGDGGEPRLIEATAVEVRAEPEPAEQVPPHLQARRPRQSDP